MLRLFEVFAIFCLAVIALVTGRTAPISCKSDGGKDVSWFFMYKLPNGARNEQSKTTLGGTEYVYIDATTETPAELHWTLSPWKINDQESALHSTVFQLTERDKYPESAYVFYNDQVDRKEQQGHGHTKGFLMFDKERVVWLIHSVPNFPNITDKNEYLYPETGEQNGQIVYCATFSRKHLNTIDVYSGVVAPTLESHLLVSTWRNGAGGKVPLHLNDSRIVANIEMLTFNLGLHGWVTVKNTADHSKWAISLLRRGDRYVCVGSLNRMFSQYTRGGETLCFVNDRLYMLLCTSLASFKECDHMRLRGTGQ